MGCCESKDIANQKRSQQASNNDSSHTTVINTQPVAFTNSPAGDSTVVEGSNISFPRYPILPAIDQSAIGSSSQNNTTSPKNSKTPEQRSSSSKHDTSSITNFYNRYVNPDLHCIAAEGVESLCKDLEIDPADFRILVLAYCLSAQVMCRFTEEEFTDGCKKHQIHNIATVKSALPSLVNSVVEPKEFINFYKWAFKFATDHEHGQRSISVDIGIAMWRLVFTKNKPALLDDWIKFIESSGVKGVSRDTWDMFLVFVNQIGDDLSRYDDTEAWPSLLDDFVISMTPDDAGE